MSRISSETVRSGSLEIRDCYKQYRSANTDLVTGVHGISFCADGGVTSILGSNGAGKSTLVSMIAGSSLPDAGKVLVDGTDISMLPSWRRSGFIGVVRQNPELSVLPALTIEENFALSLAVRKRRRGFGQAKGAAIRERAREVLSPFGMGLENRLDVLASTLSGGQRQAMAVAMAIARQPSILLLDEHVAALDPRSARLLTEETDSVVRKAGITTLMVTHDMAHALEYSDRLLMLHQGRLVMDISGPEKDALDPRGLIDRFEKLSGGGLSDADVLRAGDRS